jgi:hypothetical protein
MDGMMTIRISTRVNSNYFGKVLASEDQECGI